MAPRLRMLLALLPAACASAEEREAAAFQAAIASSRASLAALAPEAAAPASPPPSQTLPGTAAALFLGTAPETVQRRLGEPSLRRVEGSAEIWLYAGDACALDLVLYPGPGGLRVGHAAARASGTESVTEADCLQDLAAGARPHYTPAMTSQRQPPVRR
ncbi:MAG: hypothetical protein IRY87_35975 [Acetobacteraceae bacterium]|nr:hypothetical protein [Acetobacteraceae bacterium]